MKMKRLKRVELAFLVFLLERAIAKEQISIPFRDTDLIMKDIELSHVSLNGPCVQINTKEFCEDALWNNR